MQPIAGDLFMTPQHSDRVAPAQLPARAEWWSSRRRQRDVLSFQVRRREY
jgi:hypothetical protein